MIYNLCYRQKQYKSIILVYFKFINKQTNKSTKAMIISKDMKQKITQSGGALVGRQTLAIKAGSNNTKQKKGIQKQFNNNVLQK